MRISTVFFFLFSVCTLFAQPKQNSPYSRFGIGDPVNQYFANSAAWGGQTAAFHDPFHLNIDNPASFAFLRSTAFETGIYSKYSTYQSASDQQNIWSGNLAYLALGFTLKSPINEVLDRAKSPWKYGMGLSLTPGTLIGYNTQKDEVLPGLGIVKNNFVGNGGTYRLNLSNAVKYKNTSLGANIGWAFGKAKYENTTVFSDGINGSNGIVDTFTQIFFQNNSRDEIAIKGFIWRLGAQHDWILETAESDKDIPTKWITFGLYGEGNHRLNTISDRYRIRSRGILANGNYIDADTIVQTTDEKGHITLPAAFGFGFQYVKANKLKIGAQFGLESWSQYHNDARPETMRNTISFSAGLEYTPDHISYNRYLKRVRYRIGGYFREDPRVVNGKNFNDVGLTFGFGFPLILPRQQTSFVNAAFELGKNGASSPIEETYFRMTFGFTLNDNTWFYKRRFE